MKDFLGNEVREGDIVICTEKEYHNLVKAKVIKINPKTIVVEYHARRTIKLYLVQHRKNQDQFVKVASEG